MTVATNIEAISGVHTVTAAEQSATINTAISGRPSRTCLSMARTIVKRIVAGTCGLPNATRLLGTVATHCIEYRQTIAAVGTT
jgi:hypothetical protein